MKKLLPTIKLKHLIGSGIFLLGSALVGYKIIPRFSFATKKPSTTSLVPRLFSSTYPVHSKFIREISQMREQEKISFTTENSIHTSILTTSIELNIPPALLWCLIFQESRLNPLSGVETGALSTGLGQFSSFAFFEVNHHLYKFFPSPQMAFASILGSDVRPIHPDARNSLALHSYYFIPTGTTATGLYLSNRWTQLARVARGRGLSFSDDLLWGWAALSYNKGSRTILNIWAQIERQKGTQHLEKSLQDPKTFFMEVQNLDYFRKAMSHIWNPSKVEPYAQELLTHYQNIKDCSFSNTFVAQGDSL